VSDMMANRTGDAAMLDNVSPAPPPADQGEAWDARVKNILKAELKRRGIGYKELADRRERERAEHP